MAIYFSTNYYSPPKPSVEDAMAALSTVCSDIGCTVNQFSYSLDQLTRSLNELQTRMCVCENETYGYLRPELDALIEKSNQKTDLEISEQKGARRLLPIIRIVCPHLTELFWKKLAMTLRIISVLSSGLIG